MDAQEGSQSQISVSDQEKQKTENVVEDGDFDYSKRSQWLRAAVLGANDGLVSTASLMMGVAAVKTDVKAMIISGFAGLVAGACSMAIGEFVSVYSQLDIETAQIKRQKKLRGVEKDIAEPHLPNPFHAAAASALAFIVGAVVPLLSAAFVGRRELRLAVVASVASLALVAFGCMGAALGRSPVIRSCLRVLIGGLMAMAVTFSLMKFVGSHGMSIFSF